MFYISDLCVQLELLVNKSTEIALGDVALTVFLNHPAPIEVYLKVFSAIVSVNSRTLNEAATIQMKSVAETCETIAIRSPPESLITRTCSKIRGVVLIVLYWF